MPANLSPIFTLTPIVAVATVSAANANRDGTGTIVSLVTGGTNGTRIEFIQVWATVAATAGLIRFYINPNTGTYHLWKEVAVTAVSLSSSIASYNTELIRTDGQPLIVLPASYVIGVAPVNAENMRVIAHGGNY